MPIHPLSLTLPLTTPRNGWIDVSNQSLTIPYSKQKCISASPLPSILSISKIAWLRTFFLSCALTLKEVEWVHVAWSLLGVWIDMKMMLALWVSDRSFICHPSVTCVDDPSPLTFWSQLLFKNPNKILLCKIYGVQNLLLCKNPTCGFLWRLLVFAHAALCFLNIAPGFCWFSFSHLLKLCSNWRDYSTAPERHQLKAEH